MEMIYLCFFIYIVIELCYYVHVHYFLLHSSQYPSQKRPKIAFDDPIKLWKKGTKILYNLKNYSIDSFFRKSFLTEHKIFHTKNIFNDILSVFLYGSHYENITPDEKNTVIQFRDELTEKTKYELFEHDLFCKNHICKFILSPIELSHIPFAVYFVFYLLDIYSWLILHSHGFRIKTTSVGIRYWYRKGTAPKNDKIPPILYIHGIAISHYNNFILNIDRERTIIFMENRFVKVQAFHFDVPDPTTYNLAVTEILATHNIEKVSVISNSWGTYISTWIVKLNPHIISHLTMIEPITISIFLPDTIYAMLYEAPTTWVQYFTKYIIRNDLGFRNVLHRNVEWYNICLFLDEIPEHIGVLFCLSGDDEFLDCQLATEIITPFMDERNKTSGNVKLLTLHDSKHSDTVCRKKHINKILVALNMNE